ncbi:glutamate-rich protein 6 [Phaenicophaeus curvirostris]|uniref:glutamate-rich protein 6 n=1 Tax=Phaenicophaeus curvirostris TaxID=33595 RepID=UPI0037F0AEBB
MSHFLQTQHCCSVILALAVIAALSEEFSSLEVVCDMEFKEDFVKLFKNSLRTLPSVGLPTLLAYRTESSQRKVQIETEEDCAPRCEYCNSLLKPFPSFEGARPSAEDYASQFCCERNRDLYEFIVSESKNHEGTWSIPTAVSPDESHLPEADTLLSKETAYQRQLERQMARQSALLAAERTSRAERSSQAGTISYQLSQEPPSPEGRTLVPDEKGEAPEVKPISYSTSCCDFTLVGGKAMKNVLLEKYYKHGVKFLTMLPDGTAQLFYPSGHLAILVVREKKQLICIVQEDKPTNAKIQAVFKSNGRSTCYHPNGAVWINMNIQGGQYLDQGGNRVRRWTWSNSIMSPEPHVPLKPIFISLNRHVGVRILRQDKIIVSFLARGQQAKFNMGTKVEVSDVSRLPPQPQLSEDELLHLAFRVSILRLFDKLHGCLNFPSNEQRDKIKPPAYLVTQTLKILQLCTTSDISDELRSSIRAILNVQV